MPEKVLRFCTVANFLKMLEIYKTRHDYARKKNISWRKASAYWLDVGMIPIFSEGICIGYVDPYDVTSALCKKI